MLVQIITENFIISLILIVFIGTLLGEITREIDDDTHIIPTKFISSWIKSFIGGLLLGLVVKQFNMDENLISWGCILYFSFLGHSKTFDFLDSIFNNYLKKIKENLEEHKNDK